MTFLSSRHAAAQRYLTKDDIEPMRHDRIFEQRMKLVDNWHAQW